MLVVSASPSYPLLKPYPIKPDPICRSQEFPCRNTISIPGDHNGLPPTVSTITVAGPSSTAIYSQHVRQDYYFYPTKRPPHRCHSRHETHDRKHPCCNHRIQFRTIDIRRYLVTQPSQSSSRLQTSGSWAVYQCRIPSLPEDEGDKEP